MIYLGPCTDFGPCIAQKYITSSAIEKSTWRFEPLMSCLHDAFGAACGSGADWNAGVFIAGWNAGACLTCLKNSN